jgi:hypothetical protein
MQWSESVDTVRYGLAIALVCGIPPLLLFWPVIHGFVQFWRGVDPVVTYCVVLGGAL